MSCFHAVLVVHSRASLSCRTYFSCCHPKRTPTLLCTVFLLDTTGASSSSNVRLFGGGGLARPNVKEESNLGNNDGNNDNNGNDGSAPANLQDGSKAKSENKLLSGNLDENDIEDQAAKKNIKCKNVWVWKIPRFVMHISHDP